MMHWTETERERLLRNAEAMRKDVEEWDVAGNPARKRDVDRRDFPLEDREIPERAGFSFIHNGIVFDTSTAEGREAWRKRGLPERYISDHQMIYLSADDVRRLNEEANRPEADGAVPPAARPAPARMTGRAPEAPLTHSRKLAAIVAVSKAIRTCGLDHTQMLWVMGRLRSNPDAALITAALTGAIAGATIVAIAVITARLVM